MASLATVACTLLYTLMLAAAAQVSAAAFICLAGVGLIALGLMVLYGVLTKDNGPPDDRT